MSEHDDRLPMHQMLEHAREAVEMIRNVWSRVVENTFPYLDRTVTATVLPHLQFANGAVEG